MDWVKDTVQAGLYKRIRETGDVWTVKSRIKGGKPITFTIGKVSLLDFPQYHRHFSMSDLLLFKLNWA